MLLRFVQSEAFCNQLITQFVQNQFHLSGDLQVAKRTHRISSCICLVMAFMLGAIIYAQDPSNDFVDATISTSENLDGNVGVNVSVYYNAPGARHMVVQIIPINEWDQTPTGDPPSWDQVIAVPASSGDVIFRGPIYLEPGTYRIQITMFDADTQMQTVSTYSSWWVYSSGVSKMP